MSLISCGSCGYPGDGETNGGRGEETEGPKVRDRGWSAWRLSCHLQQGVVTCVPNLSVADNHTHTHTH